MSYSVLQCMTSYWSKTEASYSGSIPSQPVSKCLHALPDTGSAGLARSRTRTKRPKVLHERKATSMGIIAWSVFTLTCSLVLSLLGFFVGRCARRLPVIDDNLPWTLHRSQNPVEPPVATIGCPAIGKEDHHWPNITPASGQAALYFGPGESPDQS